MRRLIGKRDWVCVPGCTNAVRDTKYSSGRRELHCKFGIGKATVALSAGFDPQKFRESDSMKDQAD